MLNYFKKPEIEKVVKFNKGIFYKALFFLDFISVLLKVLNFTEYSGMVSLLPQINIYKIS